MVEEPMRLLEVTKIFLIWRAPTPGNQRLKRLKVTQTTRIVMKKVGAAMDANFNYRGALNQFKMFQILHMDFESIVILGLRRDI